jgi:hypothetical protein
MQHREYNLPIDSFIGAWFLKNIDLCDQFIEFSKAYPIFHSQGHIQKIDGSIVVQDDVKQSVDIPFHVTDNFVFWKEYITENQQICDEYKKKFPMCDNYSPWGIVDDTNLQYYPPGGGYKTWHTERCSRNEPQSSRHMVFMTYLNDVDDGGETEFFHQKLKIKPQKGLTLIWPADWTHTHRGIVSPSQEKYILTGWYNFISF